MYGMILGNQREFFLLMVHTCTFKTLSDTAACLSPGLPDVDMMTVAAGMACHCGVVVWSIPQILRIIRAKGVYPGNFQDRTRKKEVCVQEDIVDA
jgi:hypothetical protein